MNREEVLAALGIERENSGVFAAEWLGGTGAAIASIDPTTEEVIATVREADLADYEVAITVAQENFKEWRMLPAPERGNYVRLIGDALRKYKEPLGALVSMETGKIRAEGEGEVEERGSARRGESDYRPGYPGDQPGRFTCSGPTCPGMGQGPLHWRSSRGGFR